MAGHLQSRGTVAKSRADGEHVENCAATITII